MMTRKLSSGILVMLFPFLMLFSCRNSVNSAKAGPEEKLAKIEVSIGGMTCTGCEQTIMKNVGKIDGVKSVTASYKEGRASIDLYPSVADTTKIRKAITESGYTVLEFRKSE